MSSDSDKHSGKNADLPSQKNFDSLAQSLQSSFSQAPLSSRGANFLQFGQKAEIQFLQKKNQQSSQPPVPEKSAPNTNIESASNETQAVDMTQIGPASTDNTSKLENLLAQEDEAENYAGSIPTVVASEYPDEIADNVPQNFSNTLSMESSAIAISKEGEKQEEEEWSHAQTVIGFPDEGAPTKKPQFTADEADEQPSPTVIAPLATITIEPPYSKPEEPAFNTRNFPLKNIAIEDTCPTQTIDVRNLENIPSQQIENRYLGPTQIVNLAKSTDRNIATGETLPPKRQPNLGPTQQLPQMSRSERDDPFSLVGTILGNKHEVTHFIGRGGMGAVYRTCHRVLEKENAIKVLVKAPDIDPKDINRFFREARAAASVDHPNVVTVHDIDETESFYYIVMDYVRGKSLEQIVRENGAMPIDKAIAIIKESVLGLRAIHKADLVHRDIKLANILLSDEGRVKITDFGIVKEIGGGATATKSIIGTPQFMSPEQISQGAVDGKSDIYSLGITFYHLVTGRPCFTGTLMQMMYQVIHNLPLPPHEIKAELDEKISNVILKMIAKKPEDRYNDTDALYEVLENLG